MRFLPTDDQMVSQQARRLETSESLHQALEPETSYRYRARVRSVQHAVIIGIPWRIESEAVRVALLTFDAVTRTKDLVTGRVAGVRIDPDSRSIGSIVVQRGSGSGAGYVVPSEMLEPTSPPINIDCTSSELERFEKPTLTEVLPLGVTDVFYPSWQPLQQLREDLKNPFGRIGVGCTRPLLDPAEVELVSRQLVFGIDGVVGRLRGIATENGFNEVTELLLERVRWPRRNRIKISVALLTDWVTLQLSVTNRQLSSLEEVENE
jgi:hypothetical protein